MAMREICIGISGACIFFTPLLAATTHTIILDFNSSSNIANYEEHIREQRVETFRETVELEDRIVTRVAGIVEYYTQAWLDYSIAPFYFGRNDMIEFSFQNAPSIFFLTDQSSYTSLHVSALAIDSLQYFGSNTGQSNSLVRKTTNSGTTEALEDIFWSSSSSIHIGTSLQRGDTVIEGFSSVSRIVYVDEDFSGVWLDKIRIQLYGKSVFVGLDGEIFSIAANIANGVYQDEWLVRMIEREPIPIYVAPIPVGQSLSFLITAILFFLYRSRGAIVKAVYR